MRALLCKEYGPPEKLVIEEAPDPKVGSTSVLVGVKAAGLNFPDTLIIQGKYQFQPPFPFSPGGEIAGEVLAVGDKVKQFKPGDRVMGLTGFGAFAEKVAVGEPNLMPIPDEFEYERAAGFVMTYGTSYYALKQRGRLQPGETLLVLGAGGGVGLAAVEIGKAMGAKVIACASSDDKLALAKEAGADEFINYRENKLKDTVKKLTGGKGVDVAYDPVGGELTEQTLRSMGWCGRHLIIGFAGGDIPSVPANLMLLKGCEVVGVFWGSFTMRQPQDNQQNFIELMDMIKSDKLKPSVNKVFDFEDYAQALNDIAQRKLAGKAVLKMA